MYDVEIRAQCDTCGNRWVFAALDAGSPEQHLASRGWAITWALVDADYAAHWCMCPDCIERSKRIHQQEEGA